MAAGVKLFFYCLIFGLVAVIFLFDVHRGEAGSVHFNEQSWTEYAQGILLILAGAAFALGGHLNRDRRIPACLLTGMAALACVRELDWVFDRVVHGFWRVPAAVVIAVAVASVWKTRKLLFGEFAREVGLAYWGTLCSGFSLVFVFSRLFGMRRNWEAMLGSQLPMESIRSVRRLAEEGTELAGYALIFLAAIGFLFSCFQEWRARPQMAQG